MPVRPSVRPAVRLLPTLLPRLVVAALLAALVLSASPGPSGSDDPRTSVASGDAATVAPRLRLAGGTTKVGKALHIAQQQKGDPYKYGAEGPNAFDCSGLVYFSTHKAGLTKVPRTSAAQAKFMHHIKRAKMRRGDFMFFTGSSGVYHVGIYVGWIKGRRAVLHAPHSGTKVRVDRNWTDSWFPGSLR